MGTVFTRKHNLIHRMASLFFAGLFALSLAVSATYAWQDLSQKAANQFMAGTNVFSAVLTKLEKPDEEADPAPEVPVPGAEFYLFCIGADGVARQVGALYKTDENGQIKVDGLPAGNYYFYESRPAYGFEYDTNGQGEAIKEYPFSIDPVAGAQDPDGIAAEVTVYNKAIISALRVSKTIKNSCGSPLSAEQEDASFEFTVTFSDGGTYAYSINGALEKHEVASGGTFHLKHGETAYFTDIPVGVLYTVTETPTDGYIIYCENHQAHIPEEGIAADFINIFDSGALSALTITKEVVDLAAATPGGDAPAGAEEQQPPAQQEDQAAGQSEQAQGDGPAEAAGQGGEALPQSTGGEAPQQAPAEPDSAPAGGVVPPNSAPVGNNGAAGTPPVAAPMNNDQEFVFTVSFSDGERYPYSVDGSELKLLDESGKLVLKNGQKATFPTLPIGVGYVVAEQDYSGLGYTASVKDYAGVVAPVGVSLPFVNYLNATAQPGSLAVTKEVTGEESDPEKEFEFTAIFTGGTAGMVFEWTLDGAPQAPLVNGGTFRLKHGQTALFTGLPAGASYTITEKDYSGEDYAATISNAIGVIPGGGTAKLLFVNEKPGSPIPLPDPLLTIRKTVEGNAPEADADKAFDFILLIDGEPNYFSLKNGEEIEFHLTFGQTYEVLEKDYLQDGYVQSFVGNGQGTAANDDIVVTKVNTYIGPEMVLISGEKSWDITAQPDVQLPTSIVVYLKADGTVVDELEVTPDENGDWLYSFSAPRYGADGETEIVYTVEEAPVPGYVTSYDGSNITNTYAPNPVLIDPPVKKVVTGSPAAPADFTFVLEALTAGAPMPQGSEDGTKQIVVNGAGAVEFGEITMIAEGTYRYRIYEQAADLPEYTFDTTVYTMTVVCAYDEDDVLQADITYTSGEGEDSEELVGIEAGNSLVFTNIYGAAGPGQALYAPRVQKKIAGDGVPQSAAEFVFEIAAEGDAPMPESSTAAVTGEGEASFGGIIYTEPGVYTYTITERPGDVRGYTYDTSVYILAVTVAADGQGGLVATGAYTTPGQPQTQSAVFTNTYTYIPTGETVAIRGGKTWQHGSNPLASQPKAITVLVKSGNSVIIRKTITAENYWSWEFIVSKYDSAGKEIVYTVDEVAVPGYTTTVQGHDITNTYQETGGTETVTISGRKFWSHGKNPANLRPASITVYAMDGGTVVATQTVTAASQWRYSFSLPKYNSAGQEIRYTIDEVKTQGYGKYIQGTNLYNTFGYADGVRPPQTGDSTMLAVWIALMIASGGGMAAMAFIYKKKKSRQGKRRRHLL